MPNKKGPPKNWQEVRDEQRAMNAVIAERRREADWMVEAERKKESEKWIAAAAKAREDSILADRIEREKQREKQSSLMQAAEAFRAELELVQAADERDYQIQRQAELNAMQQLKSQQLKSQQSASGGDRYRGRMIEAPDLAEQFDQFLRSVSTKGVCIDFFDLCRQALMAQQEYERRNLGWDAQQAEGYAREQELQRRREERMRMLVEVEVNRTSMDAMMGGTGYLEVNAPFMVGNAYPWQDPTLAPPEELSVASACSRKFFLVPE